MADTGCSALIVSILFCRDNFGPVRYINAEMPRSDAMALAKN
jgi:hypothetical protein